MIHPLKKKPGTNHNQSKPLLKAQTTTMWYYPSQNYGEHKQQGDKSYEGATPSYIIWNLLQRYTKEGDVILDPFCGSGTTLDVCKDINREGLGFDLVPYREDIQEGDARQLPLKRNSVDFVFMDPPYSTHLSYSDDPRCIGKLSARDDKYYAAMSDVIAEAHRVLRKRHYLALYVSDSFKKGASTDPEKKFGSFMPIGFELFKILSQWFEPVDIICVQRNNQNLKRGAWHAAAERENFYLRGFNYLFIMKKKP